MDLGTGDGRAVVRLARRCPEALVIGVDTSTSAMMEVSRRAPANALFIAADATEALHALRGGAHEVRIVLPWGSLLRSVTHGEREFALAVAGAL